MNHQSQAQRPWTGDVPVFRGVRYVMPKWLEARALAGRFKAELLPLRISADAIGTGSSHDVLGRRGVSMDRIKCQKAGPTPRGTLGVVLIGVILLTNLACFLDSTIAAAADVVGTNNCAVSSGIVVFDPPLTSAGSGQQENATLTFKVHHCSSPKAKSGHMNSPAEDQAFTDNSCNDLAMNNKFEGTMTWRKSTTAVTDFNFQVGTFSFGSPATFNLSDGDSSGSFAGGFGSAEAQLTVESTERQINARCDSARGLPSLRISGGTFDVGSGA
jgi:hypothetical protein